MTKIGKTKSYPLAFLPLFRLSTRQKTLFADFEDHKSLTKREVKAQEGLYPLVLIALH